MHVQFISVLVSDVLICVCRRDSESLKTTSKTSTSQPKQLKEVYDGLFKPKTQDKGVNNIINTIRPDVV